LQLLTAACTARPVLCAASRLFKITWTLKEGGWPRYIATQLAGMYRQVFGVSKVRTVRLGFKPSTSAAAAAAAAVTACGRHIMLWGIAFAPVLFLRAKLHGCMTTQLVGLYRLPLVWARYVLTLLYFMCVMPGCTARTFQGCLGTMTRFILDIIMSAAQSLLFVKCILLLYCLYLLLV
jgi:hypothetical protein